MQSIEGKHVIITGATSGVGKEMAFGLAGLGADLVLACRDLERGGQTAAEIAQRTGRPAPAVMQLDASSQASIREFAGAYRQTHTRLDVLVNNAAVNTGAVRQTSADGIELTFATNVLGYHLLTAELLDLLQAGAPARLINVASTFASDLDLDDLQFEHRTFEGGKAYAQSKACNRLLTWAQARRLDGSGVTANAMTPGLVPETGLYRNAPPELRQRLHQFSSLTSADGADVGIWLASSPELSGLSGRFFEKRKELECSFRNIETEERLWGICQGLVGAA
jgi:NAD(P)-dependent dehydrogenase (short-subunit alcohol dehydrogenase family)